MLDGKIYKSPGIYYDTITSENECSLFLKTTIVMIQKPVLSEQEEIIICIPDTVQLQTDLIENATYQWIPSTFLNKDNCYNPIVKPSQNIKYKVIVGIGNCKDSTVVAIRTSKKPTISSIENLNEGEIRINVSEGIPPYSFLIDGETWDSESFFPKITIGKHTATVIDSTGCLNSFPFHYYSVIPLYPGNSFSPDKGEPNGKWEIVNIEYYRHYTIQIFDRFGKLLIEYKNTYPGWDGKYKNRDMPSTDYWYVINVEEADIELSGHFTLIR